jgi:hypothetical protein
LGVIQIRLSVLVRVIMLSIFGVLRKHIVGGEGYVYISYNHR